MAEDGSEVKSTDESEAPAAEVDRRGKEVDRIPVQIDYQIIEHFSDHLYGSPAKAVEELVANSYDAWATKCYVYLPGEFARDSLLVWDNGDSMDQSQLHRLWWIAKSPKADGTARIESRPDRRNRALIGKFGIGKLASYSLGHRVTHLCRRNDEFLRVTVDYRSVPHVEEGTDHTTFHTPLLRLSEEEAREYVASLTHKPVEALAEIWTEPSWTLAVVDQIKPGKEISAGRLRWILGNGMPLRPDFTVKLDDDEVKPKIADGALCQWTFDQELIKVQMTAVWNDATKHGIVDGELIFAQNTELNVPTILFPSLGEVHGLVSLFKESLYGGRSADLDRSHGFFVMVRDRLLNPDQPLMLLSDPSFSTFYRSQFIIHADGLDANLLADRERIAKDSRSVVELELLQTALYLAARQELESSNEATNLARRSESLLPIQSREFFADPMTALLMSSESPVNLDPSRAQINRTPGEMLDPLTSLTDSGFQVNSNHPLFSTLQARLGNGEKAKEALRAFDVIAVADLLLAGHLFDIGVSVEDVQEVLDWRDGLLRGIAVRLQNAPDDLVREAREASYKGDAPFEIALSNIFEAMGFVSERDGASGKKDVLVLAPIGDREFSFAVEAKGSAGAVDNGEAKISGAANHLAGTQAKLAVVVAREFAGFASPRGRPAILGECDATDGKVTIASLETIVALYEVMRKFSLPLDFVLPILQIVESPNDKLAKVKSLEHPIANFAFRDVLNEIWNAQRGRAAGDKVPYRAIWQMRDEWKALPFKEFELRLLALQSLSRGLILVSRKNEVVLMTQKPDLVAQQIQRSVDDGG